MSQVTSKVFSLRGTSFFPCHCAIRTGFLRARILFSSYEKGSWKRRNSLTALGLPWHTKRAFQVIVSNLTVGIHLVSGLVCVASLLTTVRLQSDLPVSGRKLPQHQASTCLWGWNRHRSWLWPTISVLSWCLVLFHFILSLCIYGCPFF